ncbi:MAG: ATP-binding cassette domain-containing protein [Rhodoferax sp.]|nr:ATP-binding cassette domain-containing protein [Rhodoferax sp.]
MGAILAVKQLNLAWGLQPVQNDLNFEVKPGEVFVIMGASGSGKSTLLRHLVGLRAPVQGSIWLHGVDVYQATDAVLNTLRHRFGVMFQGGALWSSLTVGENLMLPLRLFAPDSERAMAQAARFKLALVGLNDCFDALPATLSGGMRKRVAMARSLMLNPDLLYLDEPSAGLDPINARRLDDLILALRDSLGTTVVMVTHAVDSIFAVADRALFLDEQLKTMTALDAPLTLLHHGPARVREFLQREAAP